MHACWFCLFCVWSLSVAVAHDSEEIKTEHRKTLVPSLPHLSSLSLLFFVFLLLLLPYVVLGLNSVSRVAPFCFAFPLSLFPFPSSRPRLRPLTLPRPPSLPRSLSSLPPSSLLHARSDQGRIHLVSNNGRLSASSPSLSSLVFFVHVALFLFFVSGV